MKKIFGIMILGAFIVGCAGSIWAQKRELREAYDRGEITAAQYHQLELQRRAMQKQALQNTGQALQNLGTYFQNERAINKMNQPQTIYVVPMGR